MQVTREDQGSLKVSSDSSTIFTLHVPERDELEAALHRIDATLGQVDLGAGRREGARVVKGQRQGTEAGNLGWTIPRIRTDCSAFAPS